jgi:hypothetical protein
MTKIVPLPKPLFAELMGRLPAESRVVDSECPFPNFWLYDDQGNALVFTVTTVAQERRPVPLGVLR